MSEPNSNAISLRESYAGKHVLITGASGFLGKVWLGLMLERIEEIGRIYVLLRPRALVPAQKRFEKMMTTSPAMRTLHERFGSGLSQLLDDKVEVLDGELSEPGLGLPDVTQRRLMRDLDLIVHCAGLVDFNPDLRKAIASNVDATMYVADMVERSDHAALLHISTCYVAGSRYGQVQEDVIPEYAPQVPEGETFDAMAEIEEARAAAEAIRAKHESAEHRDAVQAEVAEIVSQRRSGERSRLIRSMTRRRLREDLKQALVDEGMERAKRWGWPNTYTYTKSIAESLLWRRRDRIRVSMLRPSIVESAVSYPFPGWNESFNGSAPLAYVMGTWFRIVPANPDAPFDVIPVDMVAKAMIIAGAAVIEERHAPVYHIASSDRNRISVGRAADLIVLAHRRHYRARGRSRSERVFKSRWDAVLTEPEDAMAVDRNRAVVQGVLEGLDLLPDKWLTKARKLVDRTERTDKRLAELENLVGLYKPFMYDCFYVFESNAIDRTVPEETSLQFAPEKLDWRRYWLDVHMPGLRRWAFPLIDGKRPERWRAPHPVRLSALPPPPDATPEPLPKPAAKPQGEGQPDSAKSGSRAAQASEG